MHLIEVLVDCRLLQDYQPDLKIETLAKECLFCPNLPGFKWDSLLVTISSSLNFWGIAYNRSSACFSVPRSFLPCLVPLVLAAESNSSQAGMYLEHKMTRNDPFPEKYRKNIVLQLIRLFEMEYNVTLNEPLTYSYVE